MMRLFLTAFLIAWASIVEAVQFGAGTGTSYPTATDTVNTRTNYVGLACSSSTTDNWCAEFVNDIQGAVVAIETELGLLPKGGSASVSARLDTLAPKAASFWTSTSESGLTGETNLGGLTTGLLLNTVAAGTATPSAYAGTLCTNQFPRSLSASGVATCASVSLSADISGILAPINGGTGWYNVISYGAIGNGSADDTTAIQNAINAAASGSVVCFPSGGTYKISAALTIMTTNLTLMGCGDGRGIATITSANTTIDLIQVGDDTTQVNGVKIAHLTFTKSAVASAGYAINARYVGYLVIDDVFVGGASKLFRGVYLKRSTYGEIRNSYITNTVSHGVFIEGTGTGANRSVDNTVRNVRIDSPGGDGINIGDYVEGFFMYDDIIYGAAAYGLQIAPASDAAGLISYRIFNSNFDTCTSGGIRLNHISNVQINNNWFSNPGTNLNLVSASVTDVSIIGNQFYGPSAGSVHSLIAFGTTIMISGNEFSGGASSGDLIRVGNAAARVSITGNTIQNASGYGINLLSAVASAHIEANTYANNANDLNGVPEYNNTRERGANGTVPVVSEGTTTTGLLWSAPTTASVATLETTTSTSYTDLATSGPARTVTIGASGTALVIITSYASNSAGGNYTFMGFAISGATTRAASDATALLNTVGAGIRMSAMTFVTGLTAGSNTFTAKYRVTAGTGTFYDRDIIVIPY